MHVLIIVEFFYHVSTVEGDVKRKNHNIIYRKSSNPYDYTKKISQLGRESDSIISPSPSLKLNSGNLVFAKGNKKINELSRSYIITNTYTEINVTSYTLSPSFSYSSKHTFSYFDIPSNSSTLSPSLTLSNTMSQSYGTSFLTSDTSSPSLVQVSTSALTSSNTLSNSATKSQTHIEKSTKTMSYSITCSSTFFILTYGQLFGLSTLVTTSVQSILHYTEQSFVTSYTYIPSQTSIETDTTTDSISYIPSITQIPTQSFTETNSMTLSPLLTPINTYVSLFDETIMMQRSLTYVLSNTIKETITLINTITLTNIEISNIISSTLTTIVPLTKTNEHQQIETYNSLLTISNSQTMIQTLSITFSSIIYSYTLFLFDSSYTHLMTEFIYYQYTIVRYVSYFSFFFSYGEQKEVETKKEIGIGIIIAIVAAVVIVVVIIVVALVLINRYMKNRITSSSCREEMAQEVNVNDWNETNEVNGVYEMKDIKEDPFAKDFEEQNFVYL